MFKQITTILVVLCFTLTSSTSYAAIPERSLFGTKSHAQRLLKSGDDKPIVDIYEDPGALALPKNAGQVTDYFKGKNSGLVIHIQDRHVDETAQLNIANIISSLVDNYDINMVLLEAASDKLDTSFYDKFPDNSIKEKVSRFFLKKALFTGPEYYKINNKDKNIAFYGVEDEELYLEHLKLHHESQPDMDIAVRWLKDLANILDNLKLKIYTKRLLALDSRASSYNLQSVGTDEFAEFLLEEALKNGIGLSDFSNVVGFSKLARQEKDIDFEKAKDQRTEIIEVLGKRLDKVEASELVAMSLDLKSAKITDVAFYKYLETVLVKAESIKREDYKDFFSYMDYLKHARDVDHTRLFDEIDALKEKVAESLFENETQRNLYISSEAVDNFTKLFELSLSHKQLEKLNSYNGSFDINRMLSFIKAEAQRYNIDGNNLLLRYSKAVSRQIKVAKEYYEIALKRDHALVDNTINKLGIASHRSAILVTGGFHTAGITNALKQKGISYAVVCPNIGSADCEDSYADLMAGRVPSIESMFGLRAQTLGHMLATGSISLQRRAGVVTVSTGEKLVQMPFRKYVEIVWTCSTRLSEAARGLTDEEGFALAQRLAEAIRDALVSGEVRHYNIVTIAEAVLGAEAVIVASTGKPIPAIARSSSAGLTGAEMDTIVDELLAQTQISDEGLRAIVEEARAGDREEAKSMLADMVDTRMDKLGALFDKAHHPWGGDLNLFGIRPNSPNLLAGLGNPTFQAEGFSGLSLDPLIIHIGPGTDFTNQGLSIYPGALIDIGLADAFTIKPHEFDFYIANNWSLLLEVLAIFLNPGLTEAERIERSDSLAEIFHLDNEANVKKARAFYTREWPGRNYAIEQFLYPFLNARLAAAKTASAGEALEGARSLFERLHQGDLTVKYVPTTFAHIVDISQVLGREDAQQRISEMADMKKGFGREADFYHEIIVGGRPADIPDILKGRVVHIDDLLAQLKVSGIQALSDQAKVVILSQELIKDRRYGINPILCQISSDMAAGLQQLLLNGDEQLGIKPHISSNETDEVTRITPLAERLVIGAENPASQELSDAAKDLTFYRVYIDIMKRAMARIQKGRSAISTLADIINILPPIDPKEFGKIYENLRITFEAVLQAA